MGKLSGFCSMACLLAAGAWSFSGNPGLAAFRGGRVVIPCGYEGLLLQRQGN